MRRLSGPASASANSLVGRMIAVIFEVEPAPGRKDDYLAIAAAIKPRLEEIDGFISVERFQSLTNPDKLLSLSIFRDIAPCTHCRLVAEDR